MRTHRVGVLAPLLDQHTGLGQRVERLARQQLVAELAVEALHIPVLPGAAWFDVCRLGAEPGDPRLDGRGHELRPVVGADVRRRATADKQVGQHVDHLGRAQPALHPDRQALAAELVDHVEGAELAALACAILDEVVGPDMVGPIRPQPQARAVVQPQAPAFRLPRRHLQALGPPDPLDALVVAAPALGVQQRRDPPVAVAPVLRRQGDDRLGQRRFVVGSAWCLALRGAVLVQHPADKALRDTQLRRDVQHPSATTRGAQ